MIIALKYCAGFWCTTVNQVCVLCLVTQSSLTLCNPRDCSPPGSSVHGILQTRILEWVAMPSSRGSSQPRNLTRVSCIAGGFFTRSATREAQSCYVFSHFSRVWLSETLWTTAHQAPLSMRFSRQEYWSGLPFPSPKAAICIHIFGLPRWC